MMPPFFALKASVISYSYARYLCAFLGFGMRRDGDTFFVYAVPESGNYVKKDSEQKPLGRFYVDEGYFSDAMYEGFKYNTDPTVVPLPCSRSWEEYIDATNFMGAICRHFAPDHEFEHSPYRGRGSSKWFMKEQYAIMMLELADTDCLLKHWKFLG